MPGEARIKLVFDPERLSGYAVQYGEETRRLTSRFWREIEQRGSFTFLGRYGWFTARKETRQNKGAYWIAYRKIHGRLRKKYIGRSPSLTLDKLEAVAQAFKKDGQRSSDAPVSSLLRDADLPLKNAQGCHFGCQ